MKKILLYILLLVNTIGIYAQDLQKDSVVIDSIAADTLLCDSIAADSTVTITVQQRLDLLLQSDMFKRSQVGLMVYDLTGDSIVYAHGEQQTLRPASTMKLTTAITALDRLGGAYQYSTSMNYRGALYDSEKKDRKVLVGDIIIKGGMDPRFGSDDMNAFIESLQKLSVDTIYGNIIGDRSFKDDKALGEGWCWDDKNPVLTPLLWNRRDILTEKLRQQIEAEGIVVLPKSAIPTDSLGQKCYITQSERTVKLCTRSHSIDQILIKMMKESDNLYAETMLYQIAHSAAGSRQGTAKHATDIIKQLVRKVGLDPSRYRFADGSGLSLYNYQSAELQIRLLRYAYKNTNIFTHLYPSLPVAGVDGTLKSRMKKTLAEGNVHAKTGTLEGISSLSGYLTAKNGNMLCFSIINQGIRHTSSGKSFQDKVCEILCRY